MLSFSLLTLCVISVVISVFQTGKHMKFMTPLPILLVISDLHSGKHMKFMLSFSLLTLCVISVVMKFMTPLPILLVWLLSLFVVSFLLWWNSWLLSLICWSDSSPSFVVSFLLWWNSRLLSLFCWSDSSSYFVGQCHLCCDEIHDSSPYFVGMKFMTPLPWLLSLFCWDEIHDSSPYFVGLTPQPILVCHFCCEEIHDSSAPLPILLVMTPYFVGWSVSFNVSFLSESFMTPLPILLVSVI